ncbi:hypothetical protein DIQ82_33920, partial [Mycolicibacterium smegmatis]
GIKASVMIALLLAKARDVVYECRFLARSFGWQSRWSVLGCWWFAAWRVLRCWSVLLGLG